MLLLSLAGTDSGSEIFCPSYETTKVQGEDEKPRVLLDAMLCAFIYHIVWQITPLCFWSNSTERGNEDSGSLGSPSTFSLGAQPV